jgi:hypothetical protein
MLRVLIDSHLPAAITQAVRKASSLSITHLRDWHGGSRLNQPDTQLLQLAFDERLTILTHDIRTFPVAVKNLFKQGHNHAGVIFVPASFQADDVGGIARALVKLSKAMGEEDWTNRIWFLQR